MPIFSKLMLVTYLGTISTLVAASPFRGAEIGSHEAFRFGAVEARLRAAGGSGIIIPFFLLRDGTENAGTPWQEMDFEIFGRSGGTRYQTQVMTPGNPRTQHIVEVDAGSSLTQYYHTYRMEWTPQKLAFYFDGRLVREERDRQTFEKLLNEAKADPMRIRMSIWAANNNWSGSFDASAVPAHVFVSYVTFERYTPKQGPGGSDFTKAWRDDFKWLDRGRWFLQNAPADSTAVNDFYSDNVSVKNGYLVLSLTRGGETGFNGYVPVDPNKPR